MTAFEILVIILSVFLAIFLVLAIAVLIMLLKVSRKMNAFADKVNMFADNFGDNVAEIFKKSITPSVIASGFWRFMRKAGKHKQSKQ